MDAISAIKTRRSIREYKTNPITKETIENIIDCARLAPTARNEQPWEFVVIKNDEIKEQISDIAPNGKFLKQAPVLISVFCKQTKYYLEDGCAATENILISAHALGLGTCWIAGDKKPYCEAVKKLLNVPVEYKLISMISLGYPERTTELHYKRNLQDLIHWESF